MGQLLLTLIVPPIVGVVTYLVVRRIWERDENGAAMRHDPSDVTRAEGTTTDASAMCGRFTQAYTWQELVALYRLTVPASNLQPRYNIAPTTTIDVIIPRGADRLELIPMRSARRVAGISKAERSRCVIPFGA